MTLLNRMNRLMADRWGRVLMHTDALHPWQLRPQFQPSFNPGTLPPGAADYLRADNPRLVALEQRYRAADARVTRPLVWDETRLTAEDLPYFRGDNAYVWQVRGTNGNELAYALTYYQTKAEDSDGLLPRLDEDELFGIHVFEIDGRLVSRDLLDSAREIQFLKHHAGLGDGPRTVLDIGAGYGRLAHRLDRSGEDVRVFATDAVARSTFVAEYYLRFRQAERAEVVPLDELEALLSGTRIDIAVNIHSFSECTGDAVSWWVERLAAHRVELLMVVPNLGTIGQGGQVADCEGLAPIFGRFGYHQKVCEPRYPDPLVRKYGVDPVYLYLFELR